MLRSKAFVKRNRKGNVVKVVKEHYLRDDIPCSSEICRECAKISPPLLSSTPSGTSTMKPHYLIPDTNVFINQLDLMEHPAFKDVIVLQTVREEVRHLSIPVYNRLNAILADKTKRFYLFANEHQRDTFVERLKDESPNDRNDRAIRVAAKWYDTHLKACGSEAMIDIIMLSDDKANKEKAGAIGVKCCNVWQYVESKKDSPELLDMVAAPKAVAGDAIVYEEHYSPAKIKNGVQNGKLIQGSFQVSMHNVYEGTIVGEVEGEMKTIYILGRKNFNRCIQGDIVAVELLPKEKWKHSASIAIEEEDEDEEKMYGEEEVVDRMVENDSPPEPTGKVVGIIRKKWRPYCGFIVKNSVPKDTQSGNITVRFRAMDKRIPPIKIRTAQAHALLGKRIIVSIDSWPVTSAFPLGHFVKTLGSSGDRETETEVLLLEHNVPFQEFSKRVLDDLPPEGDKWIVLDKHINNEKRRDFRDLDICSIDPPGCTDIDDALHARQLPNGNWEVGVHIADVTYFVKHGMPMDVEAASRGTSVYLVDKRIDMLPALLGTNLCSLRSNVDRLAFSCVWEMNDNAEIISTDFTKSVIRSKHSFTYDEAQSRIDDERMQDSLTQGIRVLNKFAKILRQQRMDNGALTLASPEVRFNLENDSQDPVDVEMKELKETNALVEEFMLLANISVAKKIFSKFPSCSMLRKHPAPPTNNFDMLRKVLAQKGVTINTETSKALADSLDKAVIPGDPYFNKLVRIMTTRCMMQAQYFCSGTETESEFRHYGLASPIYTHFTSPIRRYADVVVHRLLQACIDDDIDYGPDLIDSQKMKELCDNLNFRNRMAQQAGRSSVELFTNLYFKNKVEIEDGRVLRVLKNGIIVLVPKYGIETVVYTAKTGSNSPLVYNEEDCSLVAGDVVIKTFDAVKVEITVEGDEQGMRQKMNMRLVEPYIEGVSTKPSASKRPNEEAVEHNVVKKAKN
ncbi:exosome complex exonuclease RRP44-like protein [Mycotypha africana]|uniref:exosome complex exonuclease RRP44-like protein n=1 Tax=Mycotypha africana TaxID=64632 RepID=UPI00230005D4|nr:exosome complex exonuclease RRP44-like protein [Mycotypha africana]KAI8970424.1 exosome complex exonuclease RRP44-like protein [Mycotypha africana]